MGKYIRSLARGPRPRSLLIISAASVAFCTQLAFADTTAEWLNTAGGSWTDATSWSTNPNFPNNGTPSGTNYQALIDQNGAASYTISLASTVAVDDLTISAANAIVSQISGTLTVGSLSLNAGIYRLSSGTLSGGTAGATVTVAPTGQFQLGSSTLDNLTFSGTNLTFSSNIGQLSITNGISLSGNTLNLTGNSQSLNFDGASQTIDHLTIAATPASVTQLPTLFVGRSHSTTTVTLTLGTSATLQGEANIKDNPTKTGDSLINNGTLNANINGRAISITTGSFTNNATAEATTGGNMTINATNWSNASGANITAAASTLTFGGSWSNSGTISTTGTSTVNLGGNFTLSALGTYTPSAATTTNITGNLDNTGQTLTLNGVVGTWNLNGGTITNGIVNFGSNLNVLSGLLSNVTIPSASEVHIADSGSLTFAGTNNGTISGNNVTLNLLVTSLATMGTLHLTNGSVNNDGPLALGPTETLTLTDSIGTWNLRNGSIAGGAVARAGNQIFNISGGTLNGVTFQDVPLQGTTNLLELDVKGGLTGTGQSFNLLGANQTIVFLDTSEQLSNLTITNDRPSGTGRTSIGVGQTNAAQSPTLTLASNAAVTATDGRIEFQGDTSDGITTVVNNGTVSASTATGEVKVVFLANFNNVGKLAATNGGTITFDDTADLTNNGIITADAATLALNASTFRNQAGGQITASNHSQLSASGGNNFGTITIDNSTATLFAFNLAGSVINIINGGSLSIPSNPDNSGTLHLANGTINCPQNVNLTIAAGGTISGSGTINANVNFRDNQGYLAFVLGGPNQGVDYDYIAINGSLNMKGVSLEISLDNNFQSSITSTEKFTIVTATTGLSSDGLTVANGGRIFTTDGLGSFQVDYGIGASAGKIILSNYIAVPEPASLSTLLLGPAMLLRRRRRK